MRTGLRGSTVVLLRRVVQRRAHDGRQPTRAPRLCRGSLGQRRGPVGPPTRVRVWVAARRYSGRLGPRYRRRTRGAGHTPCFEPLLKKKRQSQPVAAPVRARAQRGAARARGGGRMGGRGARRDAANRRKPEIIALTVQSYILLGTWKSAPQCQEKCKTDACPPWPCSETARLCDRSKLPPMPRSCPPRCLHLVQVA